MAITLTSVPATKIILPPRIVLYGPEKIGKSTFTSEITGALHFDFEDGSGFLDVRRAKPEWYSSFPILLETMDALARQEHDYTGVVLDTADWLEDVIHKQVALEAGKSSISKIDYGKGYTVATDMFRQLLMKLTLLTQRRLPVVILAHSTIKRYDNPTTASYDRMQLKLHEKAAALLTEWCDAILFADMRVYIDKVDAGFNRKITKGRGGDIVLHTVASPAFVAGNRYGLPAELEFSWGALIDAFNNAVATPAANDIHAAA